MLAPPDSGAPRGAAAPPLGPDVAGKPNRPEPNVPPGLGPQQTPDCPALPMGWARLSFTTLATASFCHTAFLAVSTDLGVPSCAEADQRSSWWLAAGSGLQGGESSGSSRRGLCAVMGRGLQLRRQLQVCMEAMLSQLPPDLFTLLARRVMQGKEALRVATLCTGTSIGFDTLHAWHSLLTSAFGDKRAHLSPQYVCSFEKVARKREFLLGSSDHLPTSVFGDVQVLHHSTEALNYMSGRFEPVPSADLVIAGFECDSVSLLNAERAKFSNCITEAKGSTGETFTACVAYIEQHKPLAILLENVVSLGSMFNASSSMDHTTQQRKRKRSDVSQPGSNLACCVRALAEASRAKAQLVKLFPFAGFPIFCLGQRHESN